MLVGFIAVVVILLVIIGIMAVNGTQGDDGGRYAAEATKAAALISNLRDEGKFYYTRGETFNGISMKYFEDIGFAEHQMVSELDNTGMSSNDWVGWPASGLDDPYTGPYLPLNGPVGDNMRLVVVPLNKGQAFGIYLLKKANATDAELDPKYLKVLERTLAKDSGYVGG